MDIKNSVSMEVCDMLKGIAISAFIINHFFHKAIYLYNGVGVRVDINNQKRTHNVSK